MAYGSRVDIDDYNRNTHQGLHVTSMAAAWMNVIYGFGGMRSDGDVISFNPNIPKKWNSYSFTITILDSILKVEVKNKKVFFRIVDGNDLNLEIYGQRYCVTKRGVLIEN